MGWLLVSHKSYPTQLLLWWSLELPAKKLPMDVLLQLYYVQLYLFLYGIKVMTMLVLLVVLEYLCLFLCLDLPYRWNILFFISILMRFIPHRLGCWELDLYRLWEVLWWQLLHKLFKLVSVVVFPSWLSLPFFQESVYSCRQDCRKLCMYLLMMKLRN